MKILNELKTPFLFIVMVRAKNESTSTLSTIYSGAAHMHSPQPDPTGPGVGYQQINTTPASNGPNN